MGVTTEKGDYRMSGFGQAKSSSEFTKPGEIESIRIEPGQNGFSVNVRRKRKPAKMNSKGNSIEPYDYSEPKPKFYSDVAGVLGCIKEELGGKSEEEEDEDE